VLTGPKRSALQAMLANLGNEDDNMHAGAASSGQSRSSSSSASSGNSMPEIDELGMQISWYFNDSFNRPLTLSFHHVLL